MESDPTKNVEKTGLSRRRISSILKAPRKSIILPEPEPQENVVECAKLGEKRNSRRVSFAPANDVLLFSKEVKNTSPARSPFQDLTATTAAPTLNRGQAGVSGDLSQKITGMENLLNAPIHDYQLKDDVNFNMADNFGERTVMFSTHDASMDMTQSHTVNISTDDLLEDSSSQSNDVPSVGLDKRALPADKPQSHCASIPGDSMLLFSGRKLDLCVEKKNVAASLQHVDPEFENFLASLSKSTGPSMDATNTRVTPPLGPAEDKNRSLTQTKRADVDKENQVPPFLPAAVGKPLQNSRKSGQFPAALYPKDEATEAPRGNDNPDPFQWLFPSQDMYPQSDRRVSQTSEMMKSNQLQSSNSGGISDFKDTSLKNTPHTHHKIGAASKEDCGEKTVMFAADEMFMDLTQTHTVNIASGSVTPERMSANALNPRFKNAPVSHSPASGPASFSMNARATPSAALPSNEANNTTGSLTLPKTQRPHEDKENEPRNPSRSFGRSFGGITEVGMTELQGKSILGGDMSMDVTGARIDSFTPDTMTPLQRAFPTKAAHSRSGDLMGTGMTSCQQSRKTTGPPDFKGMGTPFNKSLKTMMGIKQVCDAEFDGIEKTVRFSADNACMDLTQSHTVNIRGVRHLLSQQNENHLADCGEKTVRFSVDDAAMDITKSHTVNIAFDVQPDSQNVEFLPASGEKTIRFSEDDAAMDVTKSHTVNIAFDVEQGLQNAKFLPASDEKTIRFSEDDAAMDVTKSHTVNIAFDTEPGSHNVELLPAPEEKTIRFNEDDAAMDVTKSHTVNIAFGVEQGSQNVKFLPASGEKTIRFSEDDAAMDVTKSHTVNIADYNVQNVDFVSARRGNPAGLSIGAAMERTRNRIGDVAPDFKVSQNVAFPHNGGETTVRLTADDAAMDVTKSHTVDIATRFQSQLQNVDTPPTVGEKTVRFSAGEAGMEMTQCLTVNIASDSSFPLHQNVSPSREKAEIPKTVKNDRRAACVPLKDRSVLVSDGDRSAVETADQVFSREGTDPSRSLVQPEMEKPDENATFQSLASDVVEKSGHGIMTDAIEAHTGQVMRQTFTNQTPQCISLTQKQDFEHSKTIWTSPKRDEAPGPSCPEDAPITNLPGFPDSREKEPEPSSRTSLGSQNTGSPPNAADQDADMANSRKSRRKSLADITSKVRRISSMINTAPDPAAADSGAMPRPSPRHDKDSEDKVSSASVEQSEDLTPDQHLATAEQSDLMEATPFSLKTKQLMSRLSVGGFKPKLPQRSKPDDSNKANSTEQYPRPGNVNVANQLSNFDNDVSDIFDEELGSCEDMSETLDVAENVEKTPQEKTSSNEFDFRKMALEDEVFEKDFMGPVHTQKRRLPEDENITDCEKRMKTSTDPTETVLHSDAVDCDGNLTAARTTTHSIESSISGHTASTRCEATAESFYKQSLFESQLEDYATDMQTKLEDGTITVLEFFKLFNIDFVIHSPRQSLRPTSFPSEAEVTPMDLLKNRHISLPKQTVYETDVRNLSDKVERLKIRMEDLDTPLKDLNKPLWEQMRHYSETELKSFGVKLKERNNFFRKTSKAQSHEMKEVLYLNLVQGLREEQQKLKGTIEKADEMLQSLDDCIHQLEADLAGVEENGFDGKPSIKTLQNEMKTVSEALDDNERQISELEMQKKQNSSKVKRLNLEIQNLESHMDMLETLSEWKLSERRQECTLFTFLHETMSLQLTYEEPDGNPADGESERKISQIHFNFDLNDEKSQCHARLVHKLLSHFVEGESAWRDKCPTSFHVPKLLQDVSLVVGRCRLLGDECHRLKLWGSLTFDILHISCEQTRICIVFSSLKKGSKFQLVFGVTLSSGLYVLQVESFKNLIGSTTKEQIEEIVASFTPARNLLTRIVKKIHETVLC